MASGENIPRKRTYTAAMEATAPRFHHEISQTAPARLGIDRNRADLKLALACVPCSSTKDVEDYIAKIAPALGMSRGRTLQYIDVGMQLERLPRLKELLLKRAQLPLPHMRVIATAILPLDDPSAVRYFEDHLLELITPRVNGEVLRGVRSLQQNIQRLIDEVSPLLRPKNEYDPPITSFQKGIEQKAGESIKFELKDTLTEVTMELMPERAIEFQKVLEEITADQDCDFVEAFSHLLHGTAQVTATLNLYCPLTQDKPQEAWIGGLGWINKIAAESWLDRVTSIRLLADEKTEKYSPTERQRTYIQGRDGTCRFPGCDVDATKCDIDHIQPYNHENPDEGGQTETPNLHCLCRRHHNLKTAGLWNVVRDIDGVEYWTSATDQSAEKAALISTESGPLSGHGRYSFDLRKTKKAQTLKEYNEQRLENLRESQELTNQAREELGMNKNERKSEADEPTTPEAPETPETPEALEDEPPF